jgi:hypothetical protein
VRTGSPGSQVPAAKTSFTSRAIRTSISFCEAHQGRSVACVGTFAQQPRANTVRCAPPDRRVGLSGDSGENGEGFRGRGAETKDRELREITNGSEFYDKSPRSIAEGKWYRNHVALAFKELVDIVMMSAPRQRRQMGIPVPRTRPSLGSSYRLVPAPPIIAEALATLFGDRDRILELDEAALRMRHRGLDGEDHAGLKRQGRVIAVISPRLVAG